MKALFLALILVTFSKLSFSQILTSSPYSRYGVGEINLQTFSTSSALGGSFIAYQQDTIPPFFINATNPAGLAGLRLSVFELGGQGQFTKIKSANASANKNNINFSYGSVGFPIRRIGGAAFGIMPYSTVGYKIISTEETANIGNMTYQFDGDGGINKVFLGSGVKPFSKQFSKFQHSSLNDTLVKYGRAGSYKRIKFGTQLLSELSVGATANYLFGTYNQTTRIIYPGSATYFNSKRQKSVEISDFTFNVGLQTHFTIDSVKYHGKDTLKRGHRILLKQKVKIGIGFFASTPSTLGAKQSNIIYNYSLDGFGGESAKDTVLNSQNVKGTITLPLEMGLGLSIKKGERLMILMDAATTQWSGFKYFTSPSTEFKNSYRLSAGINFVPNKLAYGSSNYLGRVQYRFGVSYSDGYLDLKNTMITNYAITAGLGFPVGIGRFDDVAMVNISTQFGRMGSLNNKLLQEDYFRVILGFTFNKRWFIKYKYD